MKYANDFVLKAKEETVMVGMTDTMNGIGRCYGREKDVKKTKVMGILRQPSQVSVITDQKQLENVGYFYLGSIITNNARCTCEIKSRIITEKAEFNKKTFFHQQTGLKFKEQNSRKLALKHGFVWCWKLDTLESRLETPGKFWNGVLEKDEDDQMEQLCGKWRSIT